MKKLFTFFLTLFVASSVWAYSFEVDGICYNYVNDGVEVTYPDRYGVYSGDVTIPSSVTYNGNSYSVTSIGQSAFYNCSGLTSVTIPNSVTSIRYEAFYNSSGLTSATIPNSVTSIEEVAFYGCSGLTAITIPNSVISIGRGAFGGNDFTSITIDCYVDISEAGLEFTKNGIKYNILSKYLVEIAENWDYTDETEKAVFSYYSGDIVIPESVEMTNNTYTVIGIGALAFYGGHDITSITIPNSVISIGEEAFYNCSSLTSISIPSSVNYIGEEAFLGCTSLKKVTCYAVQPPEVEGEVLENLNAYLYVPCQSVESYDLHSSWGNFKYIKCIESESVELSSDAVSVEAKNNEATFSMPLNSGAKSYTLTISNNGTVFCTLNFNENGQLVNIDFSTTKSYELKDGVVGYQFTVTGLSAGTNYTYKFVAKNSAGSVLKEYTGAFSTTGTATAVANVEQTNAITISNNQILVNGEAPAFVITVSGQKIANANLKSGVYFVVVDGEMVKVMK